MNIGLVFSLSSVLSVLPSRDFIKHKRAEVATSFAVGCKSALDQQTILLFGRVASRRALVRHHSGLLRPEPAKVVVICTMKRLGLPEIT